MFRSTNRIGTGVIAMGTGLKMVGGGDVPAYTIEFLTNSQKHPINSNQTIIVPYVELGRASNCVIKFDDILSMVSRKHAAIERRGNEVILKHLSKTNQTLLNGRPVDPEWILNNGDEIQLSSGGPRMRYLTSTKKTSTIGVSIRIQLFAQQALKPYKRALAGLLFLFVLSGAFAFFLVKTLRGENEKLTVAYAQISEQTKQQQKALISGDSVFLAHQKETVEKLAESNKQKAVLDKELVDLKAVIKELKNVPTKPPGPIKAIAPISPQDAALPGMIEEVKSHVYFLKMYLTVEGELENELIGIGTGFMLDDGRFVTARHCVQPWAFADIEINNESDEKWLIVNWLYHNSPIGTVQLNLEVISPTNKKIYLPADKFILDDDKDFFYDKIDVGYGPGKIQLSSLENGLDWAYYIIDSKNSLGITPAPLEALKLKSGTVLHVLGYTYGLGNNGNTPSPFYSTANVSQNGLINGMINVTNLGFAEGNSGGPVFVQKDDKLVSVGLVSSGRGTLGMIVPISALKK